MSTRERLPGSAGIPACSFRSRDYLLLRKLPFVSELEIKGAFGRMTLHDDTARPAVFLTGGIGITPFRSIALEAARAGLPHRLILFYSNRRPEDAAFLDELEALQTIN